MRILFIAIILFFTSVITINGQSEFELYDGMVPNTTNAIDKEYFIDRKEGGKAVFKTSIPTLTLHKPASPNGKAIIICPGGGYTKMAIEKEGYNIARRLMQDSITAFVLKYRIPNDTFNLDKSTAPLQDAQQAIRYLRQHAVELAIDSSQIGIMGFSAGGHLAASATTMFEQPADTSQKQSISVRPDFAILIYPVISFEDDITHKGSRSQLLGPYPTSDQIKKWSCEQQVSESTPPVFLVHAADDQSVPVQNSMRFFEACQENNVPAEMHIYPEGGHGFGLNNKSIKFDWMHPLVQWLQTL